MMKHWGGARERSVRKEVGRLRRRALSRVLLPFAIWSCGSPKDELIKLPADAGSSAPSGTDANVPGDPSEALGTDAGTSGAGDMLGVPDSPGLNDAAAPPDAAPDAAPATEGCAPLIAGFTPPYPSAIND